MIGFATPLVLLVLLPAYAITTLIWRSGFVNLSPVRAKVALAIRLVLLTLIILGLAGISVDLGQSREASVVVADLSNSDFSNATQMQQFINKVAEERSGSNVLGVVSVGRQATVEQPVSDMTSFDSFQTTIDHDYTNLAGGLLLGNALLPTGYEHRITVLTDGQQNVGDAVSAAGLLHDLHVRVDVDPIHVPAGPEVLVDSVQVPTQLRPDENYSLQLAIHSTVSTTTQISVLRDQTIVESVTKTLQPGENRFSFKEKPLKTGFHTFTVQISPASDTDHQNNTGSAFAIVGGKAKVLVISPSESQAANVLHSLKTTGIDALFQKPQNVVPSLAYLERFAGVVIINTPVEDFLPALVKDFVPFVRDLGHGLVVIGGTESYGMGGYGQTALEQALPVTMNLPKRKDLPTAAVVLVIESLEANTQINISKQAGKGVVALMNQQDEIAVNDANGGEFPVPLEHVRNKAAIDAAIDRMEPGDPMSYGPDLVDSAKVLMKTHATVKHIILLGDGDAYDNYEPIVKRIRSEGITVSAVATNGLGLNDFQTMENIARWGGGRYYNANNPNAIPRIFVREAKTFARSGIVEGKFYPAVLSDSPMLKDLPIMPDLTGYVATTPKPTGEMVLVSKKLDPVLAAWQYGLGRSVAWTSDASGLWTKNWLAAPGGNKFWSDLVSWTLPASTGKQLGLTTGSSDGEGTVSVTTPTSLGPSPRVTARIVGPKLKPFNIQLQPTSPGNFQGAFPANQAGAYFVNVIAKGDGHGMVGTGGVSIPYSAEYRTSGTNMSLIDQIAKAGGGSVISAPNSVWAQNLSPASARQSLSLWLWLLALLLLPFDIGVRRLVVGRRDLDAILHAIPGFQRLTPSAVPVVAPLGSIRQRRSAAGSVTGLRRSQPSAKSSQPPATAGTVNIAPSSKRPQGPRNASKGETPPAPKPPAESLDTSSSLLAAKRKRKS